MIDVAASREGDGLEAAMGVLWEAGDDVAVVHPPAVLDGEITVEIEGSTEILKKGASIHFDSRRVHSTWNHGSSTASILWCGTMDVFGDAPAPIHKKASPQEVATYPTGETEK